VSRTARNPDLHGNAPDKARVALLLIDVINDLGFDRGRELLNPALRMAAALRPLGVRARHLGIPVIYVNDNWGRWRSDFRQLVRHCGAPPSRGRRLVRALAPTPGDYFVLKPKHSGFFATALDTLLSYLGAERLVVTGLTTDNCVLFTASDAYVRDFLLHVPADCVAAIRERDGRQALAHMQRVLRADIRPSTALDLEALAAHAGDADEGGAAPRPRLTR
jgi:nicotinamidase-related amidase